MPEARAAAPMPPAPQTLLGFDFGTRRIGVAVGQRVTGTASAVTTLRVQSGQPGQPDWAELARLIETWRPDALVVGLPLAADGSRGEIARAAERFARRLHGRFHLPVHLHDERLSSHAAEHWGGAGTPQGLDAQAARIILQDWLDTQGD
ncbi:MAG: Holliday junction resolvase RuvX [Gammaproteobacteria bacterium]